MQCAVCHETITDEASHVFVCAGVRSLVEFASKPKPIFRRPEPKPVVKDDPNDYKSWGGRFENKNNPPDSKYIVGTELDQAVDAIRQLVLHRQQHLQGDDDCMFTKSAIAFITNMDARLKQYGSRVLITPGQFKWLKALAASMLVKR